MPRGWCLRFDSFLLRKLLPGLVVNEVIRLPTVLTSPRPHFGNFTLAIGSSMYSALSRISDSWIRT